MGKSEVLMIIAGIALSIMIALVTIPTFTKGSDVAKISLINSDISSIRKVSQTYVESKSTTGDFQGIDASKIHSLIPALKLADCSKTPPEPLETPPVTPPVTPCFISSANENIIYTIGTNSKKDELVITITGLDNIDDAEESIIKNQEKLNINTDEDNEDGELILHFKG